MGSQYTYYESPEFEFVRATAGSLRALAEAMAKEIQKENWK